MANITSQVLDGAPSLGDLFPTILPEPERYVYEYVLEATQAGGVLLSGNPEVAQALPTSFEQPAPMALFADHDGAQIQVVRGWPAYPGIVPMIGVAVGPDTTDEQHEQIDAGFAGQVEHTDPHTGQIIGSADYFSEPLYSTVVVELIHENRDERDRLHNALRRILFPLRRKLPDRDQLIRKVRVDGEKQELPMDEQPLVIYVSLFTVHVYYEMLVAENVTGLAGITSIEVATHPGISVPPVDPDAPPAPPPPVTAIVDPIQIIPTFPNTEN